MLNGFKFELDDKALMAKISGAEGRAKQFIHATMEYHARSTQAYARRNARWTDRSSNARGGLIAVTEAHGKLWRISISHSVTYGIWLEVRWGGRYGIIRDTVNHEGPLVMSTLTRGFNSNVFGG